ncbi:MAG: nucleotide exchange factor GrpE [Deltaproteobacteria bacterium]|nr:nucleotide exchange factor GrpE [bacterium]MCB9476974.1 nucleotide exchange factor GrpE [Deltaproteobacteria bacterium]MCB9478645.1 nucleotide exchange factor GrpE [Deltaproteobacteria bacterium]MCB9489824.1 nucleotide exchange factor GrpE [Deltaproteobacteria bacterium]
MSSDEEKSSITTDIPLSAFEEALRAVENIQRTAKTKRPAAPSPSENDEADVEIDVESDAERLGEFLETLESANPGQNVATAVARPEPMATKSDLDRLAELMEEERTLEKEAEFLRSILMEGAGSGGSGPHDEKALKEKEEQVSQLQERMVRMQAEFENFKRRINRDKKDVVRFSNEALIQSLLPIIDNFERALAHADATNDAEATIDGVRLILKQMHNTLAQNGVRKIDASGQVFDPAFHEAMATMPTDDADAGKVISQYEPGYLLHERLLRPAKVVVAEKTAGREAATSKATPDSSEENSDKTLEVREKNADPVNENITELPDETDGGAGEAHVGDESATTVEKPTDSEALDESR